MATLAERLAARPPRRTSVPIEVTDPGDDVRGAAFAARATLARVRQLHALGEPTVTDAVLAEAAEAAKVASDALAEHCAFVELQAAPSDVWEALVTEHLSTSGDDVADTALPHMLAACALDDSLSTPEAWEATLPALAWGDRESLRTAVLDLNSWTPSRALGKG